MSCLQDTKGISRVSDNWYIVSVRICKSVRFNGTPHLFTELPRELNLDTFEAIGRELFLDSFNWGRVVTCMAYAVYIVKAVTDSDATTVATVAFDFARVTFRVCNDGSLKHTERELNWVRGFCSWSSMIYCCVSIIDHMCVL